jgi:hypothetical protein
VIRAWFFLAEAYNRATNWDATLTLLDMQGLFGERGSSIVLKSSVSISMDRS